MVEIVPAAGYGLDGAIAAGFTADTSALMLVARDGAVVGEVYGHLLAHPDGTRTALLYSLDVVESHRRRGIATELVRGFVAAARDAGCTEVWVPTEPDNVAALATYAAAGGSRADDAAIVEWRL